MWGQFRHFRVLLSIISLITRRQVSNFVTLNIYLFTSSVQVLGPLVSLNGSNCHFVKTTRSFY